MMKFLLRRDVLAILIAFNAVAAVWGFSRYAVQLSETAWYLWPLTPDGPISSLCFMLFLWWVRAGKPWKTGWQAALSWIAVLGAFKYGIWTVAVQGQYLLSPGSQPDGRDWLLIAVYLGLLLEGLLYWQQLPKLPNMYAVAMSWFLVNDYVDWLMAAHPRLPLPGEFAFAMWLSIGLTVAIYFWGRRILGDVLQKNGPKKR